MVQCSQAYQGSFHYGKEHNDVGKRRDNKIVFSEPERAREKTEDMPTNIDTFGKPQFVYSWKLVPTDKTPAGKRDDIALREKEKEIQKDLDDGIDHIGKKMTVCQLYAKQIRHRANVRHGTKQGRKQLMRILQEDKLEPVGLKM